MTPATASRQSGAAPCIDYETLRIIWWLILGVLLIGFAIMDGFDFGIAALVRVLGRDDDERRVLLETVEPVWEGNQVWFVLGGGAVFAAWPLVYAVAFSGLYVAMLLLLLAFILRPVGFGYRNKLADPRWRNAWDWVLTVSGLVPALIFGVAFGNLFLGVPFRFDADMRMTTPAASSICCTPFALLTRPCQHRACCCCTARPMPRSRPMNRSRARAARGSRIAAIAFFALYSAAGAWLAFGLPGYAIVPSPSPDGPSNPIAQAGRRAGALVRRIRRASGILDGAAARACRGARHDRVDSARQSDLAAFAASSLRLRRARSCRPDSPCFRS